MMTLAWEIVLVRCCASPLSLSVRDVMKLCRCRPRQNLGGGETGRKVAHCPGPWRESALLRTRGPILSAFKTPSPPKTVGQPPPIVVSPQNARSTVRSIATELLSPRPWDQQCAVVVPTTCLLGRQMRPRAHASSTHDRARGCACTRLQIGTAIPYFPTLLSWGSQPRQPPLGHGLWLASIPWRAKISCPGAAPRVPPRTTPKHLRRGCIVGFFFLAAWIRAAAREKAHRRGGRWG